MNSTEDNIRSVEILAERIEAAHADIANDYRAYVQLAFAIANACGEGGRGLFHRICAPCPKYDRQNAEKLYDGAMREGNCVRPATLGTLFHLADMAGIDTDEAQKEIQRDWAKRNKKNREVSISYSKDLNGKTAPAGGDIVEKQELGERDDDEEARQVKGSEPTRPLPTFPRYVWPWPFSRAMEYAETDAQRDVMFLGCLTVIGTTLNYTVRVKYGGRYMYPQLQTFVLAPAASGKSILDYSRWFGQPLHEARRRETEMAMERYKRDLRNYRMSLRQNNGDDIPDEPEKPLNKLFFITANNSSTGMVQNLIDSDGNGQIHEPEADTLTIVLKSDFGNWSDTLRKSYDHSSIAFNRRTDREYREARRTRLGVLISGTPAQLAPLIPSAENGLFSRQTFYYMPEQQEWRSQFDQDDHMDMVEDFVNMGEFWEKRRRAIEEQGVHTLTLTTEQKARFDALMSSILTEYTAIDGSDMKSSIIRLGVTTMRIACVVGITRIYCDGVQGLFRTVKQGVHPDDRNKGVTHVTFGITDEDFGAVLSLVPVLLRHTSHVLSFLPSTEIKRTRRSERDEFLSRLPERFTGADASSLAKELGLNPNTAYTWIHRLARKGVLTHDAEKKVYTKKSP